MLSPKSHNIKDPTSRIVQRGYSLIPTNEKGWVEQARTAHQLALTKKGKEPDESFVIQATLYGLPAYDSMAALLDIIERGQQTNTDFTRFQVKEHRVEIFEDIKADCVRGFMLVVDNAAAKESEQGAEMMLKSDSLICAHPQDKSVAVSITYSHRYYPSRQTFGFRDRANSVIESVRLESLKR